MYSHLESSRVVKQDSSALETFWQPARVSPRKSRNADVSKTSSLGFFLACTTRHLHFANVTAPIRDCCELFRRASNFVIHDTPTPMEVPKAKVFGAIGTLGTQNISGMKS